MFFWHGARNVAKKNKQTNQKKKKNQIEKNLSQTEASMSNLIQMWKELAVFSKYFKWLGVCFVKCQCVSQRLLSDNCIPSIKSPGDGT